MMAAPVDGTQASTVADGGGEQQPGLARWLRSVLRVRGLVLVLAGLVAPLLIALAIGFFMHRVQRDVATSLLLAAVTADNPPAGAAIPLVPGDGISALAWSPAAGGPLFVGLHSGTILSATPGGMVSRQSASRPREPIVSLTPTLDGAEPRPVWLSQEPGLDGAMYQADGGPVPDGLVLPLSNRLFGLSPRRGPGTAQQSQVLTKDPRGQDDPQQQELNGLLDRWGVDATITAARGFRLLPEAEAFVVGYGNGAVRVVNWSGRAPVVIRQTISDADIALLHNGAVVAIAGRDIATGSTVRFATAGANGTINLYRQNPGDYLTLRVLRPAGALTVRGRPAVPNPATIVARDGLSLSRDGRVLMVYGQDGGIHIARLAEGATETEAPVLQRYPLPQLRVQRRGGPWTETLTLSIQRALIRRGFEIGAVDGIRGPVTSARLREFAEENGLGQAAESEIVDALLGAVWRSSAAALSPRGNVFAIAGNDGAIHLVRLPDDPMADPATAQTVALPGHGDVITHLAISADGSYLATAGLDGRLRITDLDKAWLLAGWPLAVSPTGPPIAEMTARPLDSPAAPSAPAAGDDFIIVFGGDASLAAAQDEIARARRAGIGSAVVYLRDDSYRSIAVFADAQAQAAALPVLQSLSPWSRDAYRTRLSAWCPVRRVDEGFTRCDLPPSGVRAN
ncbi:hypothetical protein DWF00_22300 [Bosea caraganae]|uniref:Peptidoglycan binding-like domain-containing protein n=1 Tax=Bosea caraganae TaxID=2763117 RepID=A0A370L5H1_9HYPH|nr:hypothetical protein [Bosea caraganae]RDJ23363.1 hypothetical protein DWF00_22300 [Bosea caraganae]RDJ24525.1 hypothetical protein DWE98_12595 [Bosea caraganae]